MSHIEVVGVGGQQFEYPRELPDHADDLGRLVGAVEQGELLDGRGRAEQGLDDVMRAAIGCAQHQQARSVTLADAVPNAAMLGDHRARHQPAHAVSDDADRMPGPSQGVEIPGETTSSPPRATTRRAHASRSRCSPGCTRTQEVSGHRCPAAEFGDESSTPSPLARPLSRARPILSRSPAAGWPKSLERVAVGAGHG
jgi:hypothetical protein